jgi:hypothetical protein
LPVQEVWGRRVEEVMESSVRSGVSVEELSGVRVVA